MVISGVRSILFTTTDNIPWNNDGDISTTEITVKRECDAWILQKKQLKFILNWDQIPSNVQYKTLNLNKLYWGSVAEGRPLRQSCRWHGAPSETLNRYFWLAPTLDFNSIIINTLLVQQITFVHKENRYASSKAALSCSRSDRGRESTQAQMMTGRTYEYSPSTS